MSIVGVNFGKVFLSVEPLHKLAFVGPLKVHAIKGKLVFDVHGDGRRIGSSESV
jgi:hypothetical protein